MRSSPHPSCLLNFQQQHRETHQHVLRTESAVGVLVLQNQYCIKASQWFATQPYQSDVLRTLVRCGFLYNMKIKMILYPFCAKSIKTEKIFQFEKRL